jgi:hypothetical protein
MQQQKVRRKLSALLSPPSMALLSVATGRRQIEFVMTEKPKEKTNMHRATKTTWRFIPLLSFVMRSK